MPRSFPTRRREPPKLSKVPETKVVDDGEDATDDEASFSLKIRPIETAKNKVPQRLLMKKHVIPTHPSSVLFNGSSGSGKSTLLANLLTRPEFYEGYFDEIHLFSPTGATDDLFASLDLPDENIHMDLDVADLEEIMQGQKEHIASKKGKLHLCDRLLIIFEDCQANHKFMNSKPFLRCFIANRHYGISTWLCGQAYNRTPRACRLQANNLFIFKGSGSEMEILAQEYCPPGMNKRQFLKMMDEALQEPHTFVHINQRVPHAERYRRNLDEILNTQE